MNETSPARDLIYIDESIHYIYKELSEGGDLETAPFKTMKDVFMWAASMGCRMGERRPLSGKRVGIFRWAQFSLQVDVPLVKAMAIADSNEVSVVSSQSDVLTVAEEFANAGVYELKASLLSGHRQPLWNLETINF